MPVEVEKSSRTAVRMATVGSTTAEQALFWAWSAPESSSVVRKFVQTPPDLNVELRGLPLSTEQGSYYGVVAGSRATVVLTVDPAYPFVPPLVRIGSIETDLYELFFNRTLTTLDSFRALKKNWNSYGAEPVASEAIWRARSLLFMVQDNLFKKIGDRIQPFNIAPLASGGIQLEWRGPGGIIEVEISSKESYGYLFLEGDDFAPRSVDEGEKGSLDEVVGLVAKALSPS